MTHNKKRRRMDGGPRATERQMVMVWEVLVAEMVTEVAFEVHRSLATAEVKFVFVAASNIW